MRLYEPKIDVRLIKAFRRDEVIPGVPIASRYGKLTAIDLTPFLGDGAAVQTSKSIREPAGGFSISLVDRVVTEGGKVLDTLYALIEPMDMVEIRFCRDPSDPDYVKLGRLPLVMRGLVSSVSRSETMSGGRPARSVSISGQDFGKILQLIQIYYLNNSVVGDNILSELAFFQKYAGPNSAKIKPAKQFVADVLDNLINPYMKRITALAKGDPSQSGDGSNAPVVQDIIGDVSIAGVVSPFAAASFHDVSLHQMLATLLDVGPFNEMFIEDLESGVQLTVRPSPVLSVSGEPIQGVKAKSVSISDEDVVSISLSRTDAGVANYFWASNTRWAMMSNEDSKRLAMQGPKSSFILFDYLNSQLEKYGVRKMEVDSSLGPDDYANYDAQTKEQKQAQTNSLGAWLVERRRVLSEINKDNVIFEHGTLRVKGNERIRAGMQLYVTRGSAAVSTFYVTKVDHSFSPFQGFTSTLTVERGTNFIVRSQRADSDYFREITGKGVR